jgi:hypothetical protein
MTSEKREREREREREEGRGFMNIHNYADTTTARPA